MKRVVVVGGGPVGLTAALLLSRHGVPVTVVERTTVTRSRVRTVALDDESLRIWQACGVLDRMDGDWAAGEPGSVICRYVDRRGRDFLSLRRIESDLGFPQGVAVNEGRIVQTLEQALIQGERRQQRVRFLRGMQVEDVRQDATGVLLRVVDDEGGVRELEAEHVVACDGGDSTVRRRLGIAMVGRTLDTPWLVANLSDRSPVHHARIQCGTPGTNVMMSVPHGVRRIECVVEPSEIPRLGADPEAVRHRLARVWPEAATAEIIDAAVLRFEARIASRWRVGRCFLAGDAAHQSPPFAGQGLATGLRDVFNLSFKIAGSMQGWLDGSSLDTYEQERRPHQERMLALALRLGRLMHPRSRVAAALGPPVIRLVGAVPGVQRMVHLRGRGIRPRLRSGFLGQGPAAGRILPQPRVEVPELGMRPLDELLGPRMTWIVLGRGTRRGTSAGLPLDPADTVLVENRDFREPGRRLQRVHGSGAVLLVRPDRVIHSHHRRGPSRATTSWRTPACSTLVRSPLIAVGGDDPRPS